MRNEHIINKANDLLKPYYNLFLECDGFARIFSHFLQNAQIPFTTYYGYYTYKGRYNIHFWTGLNNTDHVIDCRLGQMFPEIPKGIFKLSDYEGLIFTPKATADLKTPTAVIELLVGMEVNLYQLSIAKPTTAYKKIYAE